MVPVRATVPEKNPRSGVPRSPSSRRSLGPCHSGTRCARLDWTGLADHNVIPAEPVSDQPVPGVRVANIGWQTRRRYEQPAHDRLAAIEQPVSTGWAFREAHKIAGLELILALRVAQ